MKLKHLYEAMALKKHDNVKIYNSENVEIIKNLNLMIIPYAVRYKLFASSKTIEMPQNLLNFITTNKTSSDGQKNTEILKQLANNDQFNDYFDEILPSDNIFGFKSFKDFNIPNIKGYTDWYIPSETEALNILLAKKMKTTIGTSNLYLKPNNDTVYEHPKEFIYQIYIVDGSIPRVVKDHGQTTFVISHLIRKI